MRLCIVSHKDCWWDVGSGGGVVTDGGFPAHAEALASLFDTTTLCVPVSSDQPPTSTRPVRGVSNVVSLAQLDGEGTRRKLGMIPWTARNALAIWRAVRASDVVHAPIPGDVGSVGMVVALLARRRLFVRHCGNWTHPRTTAERVWIRVMEMLRGDRYLMLATGGGDAVPSERSAEIEWIFSTALSRADLEGLATRRRSSSVPARLCIACRLVPEKGVDVAIQALAEVVARGSDVELVVVGGGSDRERLEALVASLGLGDRVRFTGSVGHADVLEEMRASDVFVYPTRASEGFPKVVLEALAVGLPTVSTDVSVIPRLVAGGGRVVGSDPAETAAAIEELLSDDEAYSAASAAAVSQASDFSTESWAEAIGARMVRRWGRLSERVDAR